MLHVLLAEEVWHCAYLIHGFVDKHVVKILVDTVGIDITIVISHG